MTLFLVLCCDRCHAAGGWQTGGALQHRGRHGADRCKDLWGHHDHAGQQHASFIQGTSALSLTHTHTHTSMQGHIHIHTDIKLLRLEQVRVFSIPEGSQKPFLFLVLQMSASEEHDFAVIICSLEMFVIWVNDK